jgi:hypothetical protein
MSVVAESFTYGRMEIILHACAFTSHCMWDTFVVISFNSSLQIVMQSSDESSDELGKTKIFIIEMVLNVMLGPDGWRNGRP